MRQKILIPLFGDDVAPRFDLAREVLVISRDLTSGESEDKMLVLPQTSSDQICRLVLTEGIHVVICGGIEEEYYHYLVWKKVKIFDSIMSPWKKAFEDYCNGALSGEKS